jgi:geranylgeranyl diphosphate synthase type II
MAHQKTLKNYIASIEEAMERYLPNVQVAQARLLDAMHYSLFAGGKRVRPVILLEFCRLCGGAQEDAMPFAAALEMIHTYSLIHDDLPCMDDDDMRRGRPSNHLIFGEATATLAGDALLTAAFETMLDADNIQNVEPKAALRAAHSIAWASGVYGMAGGQELDIAADEMENTLQTAAFIHGLKTGALFRAAAEAGCILGGADRLKINYAASFANYLGLVFQIQDDILNIEGTSEALGKSTGTDSIKDKLTFVKVLGLQKCKHLVRVLTMDALECLEPFGDIGFLTWLTNTLAKREN